MMRKMTVQWGCFPFLGGQCWGWGTHVEEAYAFAADNLHGAHREVGQHDGERLDERLAQHGEDVELAEDGVVIVETGQEQHPGVA